MSRTKRFERSTGDRRRRVPTSTLCLIGIAALAGCQAPDVRMTAPDSVQLKRRALTLLQRAAAGEDDVVRANAIEALVNVDPRQSIPLFRAAAADKSKLVRYAGCLALGEVRDADSHPLFRRLLAHPDPRIRLAAAFAACRCGDRGAARILVNTLNDHPDEKLRADAAFLIGRLGEPRAKVRLRLAERREKSNLAKVHIVSALAMLGDEDSIDALIYYTQSDIASRLVALQTIAEIAPRRARDALLRLLGDEELYLQVRLIAARALGRLGSAAGYDLAIESLSRSAEDPNETMQLRANAALALGAIGRTSALSALEHVAKTDTDARTQVAACYAICEITQSSHW